MPIHVRDISLFILNLRTRMPFRYGIATLTTAPHLFMRMEAEIDGRPQVGISADILPPKWLTKDPNTPFEDDVRDMLTLIRHASAAAISSGEVASVFDLWQAVHAAQERWATEQTTFPPLLWNFGVSLVERAAIDAHCRATGTTFADALRRNTLGIRLGEMRPELSGASPSDLLPPEPLRSIHVRHTVGLSDPLTDDDIPPDERLSDGLPQSLVGSLRAYGLRYFKIKLSGDVGRDLSRLRRLAALLEQETGGDYRHTLDGNENFRQLAPFRQLWDAIAGDASLQPFLDRLIFVEQPLHRDAALSDAVGEEMRAWTDRPPLIIDESDATLASLPRALAGGYVGTSHKNCKGIMKGIANACLIAKLRRDNPAARYELSAEDLTNIGPVALLQDLAVLASLGIAHAERNGQHYFRGLSMVPADVQEAVLARHGDLYRRHDQRFATLDVRDGRIDVGSVIDAPFGHAIDLDVMRFTPADQWSFDSLG